jgi:hypothetical protein
MMPVRIPALIDPNGHGLKIPIERRQIVMAHLKLAPPSNCRRTVRHTISKEPRLKKRTNIG